MNAAMPERVHDQAVTGGVWDCAVGALTRAGVTDVFGLPDDDMLAMGAIELCGMRLHRVVRQGTAVHMAWGYAAARRGIGVCVIGRGPAVAASVPGLLEALESRRPLIVLAAGTAESRVGTGAFQDAPTLEMVAPVTKQALRITDPRDVNSAIARAVATAQAAPAGPVYLELADSEMEGADRQQYYQAPLVTLPELLSDLSSAQRPVLMLGSGAAVLSSGELVTLAEDLGAGVMVTASGRGCFPEGHPMFLGLAGLYSLPQSVTLLRDADMILTLGTRLEETTLEGMPLDREIRWLQVNIIEQHLVRRLSGLCAVADLADITAFRPRTASGSGWVERLKHTRQSLFEAMRQCTESRTAQVLAHLSETLPEGSVTVHENGLHDIWSYSFPHLQLPIGGRAIVLSEQTTLGGGVAAAAGAAVGDAPLVVGLTGDTALSTLLPELYDVLETTSRLLYVVFDDGGMGWLDREARSSGIAQRFIGDSTMLERLGRDHVVLAATPQTLRRDVIQAVERAMSGRPTLLWIPVESYDIAPQLEARE